MKKEEEEKVTEKKGRQHREGGATRLKTRIRGTESPRTEIGRTVKNSRKKESLERKTHKENIGHVSGGVHKGEINKEEAKDVKEEEVPRLERRQRKWEDRGIRIGTTNNRQGTLLSCRPDVSPYTGILQKETSFFRLQRKPLIILTLQAEGYFRYLSAKLHFIWRRTENRSAEIEKSFG